MAKPWPPNNDKPWSLSTWSEWRWLYRRFIGFFQRGWRGWAPHDTWGLDSYLAGVLAEALPYLAAHKHGFPVDFFPDGGKRGSAYTREEDEAAAEAWRNWLLDMAEWFEWYHLDEDGTSDDKGWIAPDMSNDEKRKRIDAYMEKRKMFHEQVLPEFIRHWGALWD